MALPRRRALAAGAALGALAALGGCGFQLRRPPSLPFQRIALTGFAKRSPLAEELRRTLGASVTVVEAPAQAELVLHALTDVRERSVVASTSSGQVREVTLRLRFEFRAELPGGKELVPPTELVLTRDMSYSETIALAKQLEEAQLYREMQSDVVAQVTQRLSTVRVQPG